MSTSARARTAAVRTSVFNSSPSDAHAAQVEAQVGHHLVVPAAPGVHLAARRADQLGQPPLVGRVDVLVAVLDGERPGLPLAAHLLEPAVGVDMTRSTTSELLKRSMTGSVLPVKRPPQSGMVNLQKLVCVASRAARARVGRRSNVDDRSLASLLRCGSLRRLRPTSWAVTVDAPCVPTRTWR